MTSLLFRIALLWVLLPQILFSDVKGTSIINFLPDNTNVHMVLNSTGLGVGTSSPSANLHAAGNALISSALIAGGTTNPSNSNLHINGTWGFSIQSVTGNTTLSGNSVILADTSAGNITLTLPTASTVSGRIYTVKKTNSTNSLLLQWIGGWYLELVSDSSIYPSVQVMSNGSTWHVISQSSTGVNYRRGPYILLDVSGGPAATSYPVSYSSVAPDLSGTGNLFKTNTIVLKWIEPGRFTMGNTSFALNEHSVVLTEGFWAGVFEVTQRQWLNVMANYPTGAQSTGNGIDAPLHQVSWNDIRGTNSFMANLQVKTGLRFDLPTEAQWEYMCRAGTTTLWSYSDTENGNYMWYTSNNSPFGTKVVGSKLPNPWGLYDMHGNVWEWVRDIRSSPYNAASEVIDPVGTISGSNYRGGDYTSSSTHTRSAFRNGGATSSTRSAVIGFRMIVLP